MRIIVSRVWAGRGGRESHVMGLSNIGGGAIVYPFQICRAAQPIHSTNYVRIGIFLRARKYTSLVINYYSLLLVI